MNDMLIGISPDYLYLHEKQPKIISDLHKPYFLVFCPKERNIETARNEIINKWTENKLTEDIFSKIEDIGEIEKYNSFLDFGSNRKVFKIYTKKSYFVPEVSDYLFFNYNLFTAEHDIPYQQRALVDLAATDKVWLFDSNGKKKKLKVLVYDIETSEFGQGKENIPIDIIGYSDFDIVFESNKNLENEEFSFDIIDCPEDWKNIDFKQMVSRNVNEEVDNLAKFCSTILNYDIISGHNIIGFDNFQIYKRINWILKSCQEQLSSDEKKIFQNFISKYSRPDKSFYFGIRSEAVQFYPCSFDTYLGVRKFYSFLDDFSLKSVAPFLGIHIKDRIYLTPEQIKIDEKTLKYNKQDVQEQIGVTLNLIQQALPLSFTTCMPFDMLLSSGAVNMWDHMSLIRGAAHKKIMPPICRVLSISQTLLKDFRGCNTKEDIIKMAKGKKEQLSKDFIRVIKYGDEMPNWMEYPYVIYNINATDSDDILGYHMPGGMTIKPDKEAFSHFIPWFYVIVADVGAMYPTILKAMNIGADTVRLAKRNESPDDWIWLKKIPKNFLANKDVKYREITKEESFADTGIMLGIKIDKRPGVVNCAMTGIIHMIAKIKEELKKAKKTGNKFEVERLKMMYQSVKGARNAGSVDYSQRIILVNPDGKYENIKIGEFVDRAINKFGYFTEKINGTEFEIANVKENWKAISINKNGKVEIKKVKQAVRHKWRGKLVKILTKSGFTVVTQNHSVFTIKNGKIIEISAEQIKEDTLLVHAKKIPNIEKKQKINLINIINKPDYYGFIEKKDLKYFNGLKGERQYYEDCYAIPPKNIEFVNPSSDYVYDISVEDNENFIDANGGILLHNTHGILAAPTVSGRQFNLWGAAAITTKGQAILADTLNYLKKKNMRVIYGDTDGLYLGCSKSVENVPEFSKCLGISKNNDEKNWITKPEVALSAIKDCDTKWQKDLNYSDFELEPETHDCMIFVKHKNYLIFDAKDGKIEMITKGNNFKGSDKADIARKALNDIMIRVLKENHTWTDEEEARKKLKESIVDKTKDVVSKIDLTKVDLNDLTLVQSVQPAKRYKPTQNGSWSVFGKRSAALENLLGHSIRSRIKLKFVVTKKPLPGISNPSKSGVKPIDFMYPIDFLKSRDEIDLDWYKKMIENYIQGAFGLSDVAATEQTGLDAWM